MYRIRIEDRQEEFRTMTRRLAARRQLARPSAGVLAILLAGCAMTQAHQAAAQDAPSAIPAAPSSTQQSRRSQQPRRFPPATQGGSKDLIRLGAPAPSAWSTPRYGWPSLVGNGAARIRRQLRRRSRGQTRFEVRDKVPDRHRGARPSLASSPKAMTVQLQAPEGGFAPDLMIDGKRAAEGPLAGRVATRPRCSNLAPA